MNLPSVHEMFYSTGNLTATCFNSSHPNRSACTLGKSQGRILVFQKSTIILKSSRVLLICHNSFENNFIQKKKQFKYNG